MTEQMMVVADLLDHNPGRSLIEILYLSTKTPYHTMANNLRQNGYSVLVLSDGEVERRAADRLRRRCGSKTIKPIGDEHLCEFTYDEIQNACTPAYIEFLIGLEKHARDDKKRREVEAEKAADAHAQKVEAARQELIKASGEEERARAAYEKSNIEKQLKLQAYLDLLDERRNYQ